MRQYSNLHLLRGKNPLQRTNPPDIPADDWEDKVDQLAPVAPTPPSHDEARQSDPRSPHSGELIRGWADVPLLPEGIRQAKRNGRQLKRKGGLAGIITPALRRSVQTARATALTSGLPILTINPKLATRGWGALDGQPLKKN